MFLLIALALLLSPLGICLSGGPAMAAPSHGIGIHHATPASGSHQGHGDHGKLHYCPDCQAPSFVKSGKVATPDIAPLNAGIFPRIPAQPPVLRPARAAWVHGPSTRAPPIRRTYRIRLQI
jgi:hypothetical protein